VRHIIQKGGDQKLVLEIDVSKVNENTRLKIEGSKLHLNHKKINNVVSFFFTQSVLIKKYYTTSGLNYKKIHNEGGANI